MFPITITLTVNDRTMLDVVMAALSRDGIRAAFQGELPINAKPAQEPQEAVTANTHPSQDAGKRTRAKATPAPQEEPAKAPEITYQDTAELVTKYATRNRDAALELLGTFGLKTLKGIELGKLPPIHAAFTKALAESTQ